jgi:hypothetical protein
VRDLAWSGHGTLGAVALAGRSDKPMRADELVVLTKAEYDELKARPEGGAGDTGELFNSEEMQAIRDQYEERIIVEQEKREELEWKLRMELARIRDAELSARRAADEMRRIELTLQGLLTDEDITEVRSTVPSARLQAVAPKSQAVVALRKPVPPPIPASVNGHANGRANGHANDGQSHADKFRAAMAHRKSYDA